MASTFSSFLIAFIFVYNPLFKVNPYFPNASLFHFANECTISKCSFPLSNPTDSSTPVNPSCNPVDVFTNKGDGTLIRSNLFSN